MMHLAVEAVTQPGFTLAPDYADGKIVLRLSGNADMLAQTALAHALRQVQAEADRLHVREVQCQCGDLYFMNSSCFKFFVIWVTNLLAAAPDRRYRIHFVSNRQLAWQRRTFEALRCLAEKIVTVES
jgi:hypothetical protein